MTRRRCTVLLAAATLSACAAVPTSTAGRDGPADTATGTVTGTATGTVVTTTVAAEVASATTAPPPTATVTTATLNVTAPTVTRPSSTTSTTSTSTTSTTGATSSNPAHVGSYPALAAATADLGPGALAVSVTVRRRDGPPFDAASGRRVDGGPVGGDTPFVVASVGKLFTALSIARLVTAGEVAAGAPVPWSEMGLPHDPAWDGVTVRELLDHASGMPVNRQDWLDDPAPCWVPLVTAMAGPPTGTRGAWRYSNGNYCALGLLVEHLTGQSLDAATYRLVFDPAGVDGPYLASDGERPESAPYVKGISRLQRLGGAGEWLASTQDVATVLADVRDADLATVRWPGIFQDQYGWGHTGTVDGATACAWVMESGRTVLAAAVSGEAPGSGGALCDRLVPALAADLGIWAGDPVRVPL